jgi:hypothetical protein
MFILSIIAVIECCLTITFPQKVLDVISSFENNDEKNEILKKDINLIKIFVAMDFIVRMILPFLLLFSPFKRFHIYGWIFIAQFLMSDIVMLGIKKKYYFIILLSAVELCIFVDIIRGCFSAMG